MTFKDDKSSNVEPVPIDQISKVELDKGLVLRMEEFVAGNNSNVKNESSSSSSLVALIDDGNSRIIPSNNKWIQGNDDLLPFPLKLHAVLDDAETNGFDQLISWHSGGEAFKVHEPQAFCEHIMPKYFRSQSKFKSFQRQLNLYGFERISRGYNKGFYRHALFKRGQRELSSKMKLQKIKGSQKRDSFSSTESAGSKKKRDSVSSLDLDTAGTSTKKVQHHHHHHQSQMMAPNTNNIKDNESGEADAISQREREKQYNKRVKRRSKSGSSFGKTFFTV